MRWRPNWISGKYKVIIWWIYNIIKFGIDIIRKYKINGYMVDKDQIKIKKVIEIYRD